MFNRDLSTGAKYYVINYDDVSGKSDTVTSGTTQNSNRVLFVYNKKNYQMLNQEDFSNY